MNGLPKKICLIGFLSFILLILSNTAFGKVSETAQPSPAVVDYVIHDKGNIVIRVDNYGRMPNYSYNGYPAGEWPKNSGRDYIGEMKYWFGSVTAEGDTIVLDTYEDSEPLPSNISGVNSYNIRLSTDTTRYDYDPLDTTGAGIGNAAYGWRIWNADSSAWVYNQIYSTTNDDFYPGGPTALQQSTYRFADAEGSRSLGLKLTQTIYQWNYCYNEDLLFVVLEITNDTTVDYPDFAFAVYSDFDIGGPNAEGENGRLGDLVASDSSENLAWTYDEDGYDMGWGPLVQTGIMGTKYLETPDDIGMTAFRTGQWEEVANATNAERFVLINSEEYNTSLPPTDQYYLQCTRGINLTAGKTVRVVYAIIAGQDEAEFYNNAAMAQTLYDNYFVGPQPPAAPTLSVRIGDTKNYFSWNDTAEVDVDPLRGVSDFRGYKLYRSSDQGYTWGFEANITGDGCLDKDYIPITAFQVDEPGDIINHSYIDSNLTNGMEYWYCLVAYDSGDTSVPIGPLQNGFGRPNADKNVVRTVPRSDPAGAYTAQSTVVHTATNVDIPSDGEVYAITFDESQANGSEYSITFSETNAATYWHLINNTTGDTALANQTRQTGDPGLYETSEGIRVVVRSGDRIPTSMGQTGFASAGDTSLAMEVFYGSMGEATGEVLGSDKHFRSTYEIRFTAGGSEGYWWWNDVTPMALPFEVWNTTLGYQVIAEVLDYGGDTYWDPADGDLITIVNIPYDGSSHPEGYPYNHAWIFGLGETGTGYAVGDIFTIEGAPVNGADDIFTFKIDGVNAAAASAEMKDIKVAPNPFIVEGGFENRPNELILFNNLPNICTVRIYTLSGDLVKTLEHNSGDGTAEWNLLSGNGLIIAPGIFIYHVESDYGNHVGRFAVIR